MCITDQTTTHFTQFPFLTAYKGDLISGMLIILGLVLVAFLIRAIIQRRKAKANTWWLILIVVIILLLSIISSFSIMIKPSMNIIGIGGATEEGYIVGKPCGSDRFFYSDMFDKVIIEPSLNFDNYCSSCGENCLRCRTGLVEPLTGTFTSQYEIFCQGCERNGNQHHITGSVRVNQFFKCDNKIALDSSSYSDIREYCE